jgi:GNAT superfamily N-acetyltransferase
MEALVPLFSPEKIIEASKRQVVLVGILEDALVGTATLDNDWVKNVFVDVARHRSGIGKKLMAAIEAYAQGQDLKKVYLMAAMPACGFYEKLGYTIVKRSERDLNGIVISEVQMEKVLPTMNGE